jgi:chromosome segregation ATPase
MPRAKLTVKKPSKKASRKRGSLATVMEALLHFEEHVLKLESVCTRTLRKVNKMASDLDRIETEVSEMSDAVEGAVRLLSDLSSLIRDNVNDPARLKKIADDLDAKQQELAEAILANTPAAEPPVETTSSE